MMSWRQDHVHFKCSDCQATVRFFQENFGAIEESRDASGPTLIVTLRIGQVL